MLNLRLTPPQLEFVRHKARWPAFVGGFGSGKSHALVARTLALKCAYPELDQAYFAPTYDLLRLVAWPRFCAMLDAAGAAYTLNKSERIIHVAGTGSIIFRSLDNPESIVGFEVADAAVDELDTLPKNHAEEAWNKVIARCRQRKPDGRPNTACAGTTPEGFRFAYERWERNPVDGYALVRAATASNPFNPPDYETGLRATYPEHLLAAYLDGRFVNLTTGSVYPYFDRRLNGTDAIITPNEELHIGMDFNVLRMAAVVCVIRDGWPLALEELTGIRDTPAMIEAINERFPSRDITIYPDASGASHKSVNASWSDIVLLRNAGFTVRANASNPPVRDRIVSVNAMLKNGMGERRLRVNVDRCPKLTAALEQQAYDDNGQPDKSSGLDHPVDAIGYFIHWRFPASRSTASKSDPRATKHVVRPFTADWLRARESEPKPRVW